MGQKFSHPVLKKEWCKPVKEGGDVPEVMFKTRVRNDSGDENPFEWKDISSTELFKGKKIVLFALPGAFTPTCSNTHLPGFEEAYDELKALGIDEVYCLSVNDAFVMRQWGLKQGLEEDKTPGANGFMKVKLLPDGAAHFTRGMGMSCMWDVERGFGERSWRYSAVLNDMKVEKLFIEGGVVTQNSAADPFEVSDAKTMLEYLKKSKEEAEAKKEEAKAKEEPKKEETKEEPKKEEEAKPEETAEKPKEKEAEKPVEKVAEKPVEKVAEKPAEEVAEKPKEEAEKPAEEPGKEEGDEI